MKLSVQQQRCLANLLDCVDQMELYWDTVNGQMLSRSLESARTAFIVLEPIHRPSRNSAGKPRLIIEAHCSTCGPLDDQLPEGLSTLRLAMRHSSALGRVVILNGTTDLAEDDERSSVVHAWPNDAEAKTRP